MKVSLFKRLTAFLLDTIPIIFTLSVMLNLFVGDILKEPYPNYDENYATYTENIEIYYNTLDDYDLNLEDEVITQAEYDILIVDLRDAFLLENDESESMIYKYYTAVLFYFIISYMVIKYFYNVFMKGQTLGLKMMKLELVGRVNWFTLLLREVFWRELFWIFTFSIGLWIDFAMILFTKNNRTLRDIFSETKVIHQGTSYPF